MTIQGDITTLTLLELKQLKEYLKQLKSDPYFTNTKELLSAVDAQIESDHRYAKGLAYFKEAVDNGLEDGYAEPEDYYFAVYQPLHLPEERLLLLCFKHDWWMNGEVYLPGKGGSRCRNFDSFDVDEDHNDSYSPEYYTETAEVLRKWFTSKGMEEKPELIGFYEKYLAERR